jgi:hypothetical protein
MAVEWFEPRVELEPLLLFIFATINLKSVRWPARDVQFV